MNHIACTFTFATNEGIQNPRRNFFTGIRGMLRMVEKTRSKRIGDMARPVGCGLSDGSSNGRHQAVGRLL